MICIGKGKDYLGVEVFIKWYERNINIFVNFIWVSMDLEDCILVIFGFGYVVILRELIWVLVEYELVEVVDYL